MTASTMQKDGQKPFREFHVSRKTRDKYDFNESLFTLSGNVIFANYLAARTFAQKMNMKRDLLNYPERAVKAGQLIAMGLIDEILHYIFGLYMEQSEPAIMEEAMDFLSQKLGREALEKAIRRFTDEFPPLHVYRRDIDIESYLDGETAGVKNRLIVLEEMLLLWLANTNPAFSPFFELFEDTSLRQSTKYLSIIESLRSYFQTKPYFGPEHQNLVDMMRSAAVAAPHSLAGQLEYIMEHWGYLLGKYFHRMLKALDLFKEEEKSPFLGPGPAEVYRYTGLEFEAERFTPDREWMPRLVLMAKNIYVWLDQLSKKYGRLISKLNEIPDEELEILQTRGFTGLWLIGVWERSPASQKIKQLCGNPEAVPSAYSLYDYRISDDLGGDEAFQGLKERAWMRGVRLASDMVPNHVGISSRWVVEHPDWFISLDHNPFPWYGFNGPDLSHDERVSIQIEDHYYDRSDAAVVFRRRDRWTGDERYVYHGNDGTSMPWNDTAQLNYLNPEVREAMIRTILHVARQFPVIRFDAAMTLTKRHYQRLWYPDPGTGGAIPTRVEHSLSKEKFDQLMPNEFWREVVDRIAEEAPDTLLLAEAFWLLEGYFVRTLGMHRVYNSAFMNMLRDEDNAKYRTVMKNTLEFDPEILRRFVNFMNNPDERTAVDQFGKDDKYFGVCTLMATMPGLPMFGHGQIEGYAEKYGMEYRRAYWDETPDQYLVERHEREIFPLLHIRPLFAGVEHFLLYDFFTVDGRVNEDVFAYSNKSDNERSLVVFNNHDQGAAGWIRTSVAYSSREEGAEAKRLVQKTLGQGLTVTNEPGHFTIFRDHISHLEYVRDNRELAEKGLYIEVGPYKCHTFLNFREVRDNEWRHYAMVAGYLSGRGVPSIEESMQELFLRPVHERLKELINVRMLERLSQTALELKETSSKPTTSALIGEIEEKTMNLIREIKQFASAEGDEAHLTSQIIAKLNAMLSAPLVPEYLPPGRPTAAHFCWLFVHALGKITNETSAVNEISRSWIDEWMLDRIITATLSELGCDDKALWEDLLLIRIFTAHQGWYANGEAADVYRLLEPFVSDSEVQRFLKINRYKETLWFNKETFELLLSW
ncbi:MAG TPA: alpha-amylase family glycosyl hydrolase, partial [Syntrophorhabdaceae bacterium]|nr:alpha-amylase family glycosyl hydrolase [Syntrophorhabdaceae bacterium]